MDRCVTDPASCLPDEEEVDRCVADPASCLPDEEDVERCVDSAADCLAPPDRNDEDGSDRPGAAPGGGTDPPASSDTSAREAPGASVETGAGSAPLPAAAAAAPGDAPIGSPLASAAPSLLERVGEGLADAAREFTFPLLLGVSVAAYLLIQGRIDRKDPKLAAAPVDARDDVVLFQ